MATFPILATLLSISQGHVWIVDDDGGFGVDFTDVQPAIDVAAPGDSILVREGSYGSLDVAKALTVFGEAPDGVDVDQATVHDTAPGQRVSLVALHGPVQVERCSGLVTLQGGSDDVAIWSSADVRVRGLDCGSAGRCKVTVRGSRLELVGSRIEALNGDPGDTAIRADGSVLHVAQVARAQGGNGLDSPDGNGFGSDAGHGLLATSSQVLLTGTGQSVFKGGDGGWGDCCQPYWDGRSGHGIAVVGGSSLRRSGVKAKTGVCWGQWAGCGVPVFARFDEQPDVPDPVLQAFDRLDGAEGLRVFAEAGAHVRLQFGVVPTVEPGAGPVEQLLVPLVVRDLGTSPGFGVLETVSGPALAAEPLLLAQAVVVGQDGSLRRTNSIAFVRPPVPCSDVPLVDDCDGDGLDDACELMRGLETDCDGDGTVDACQQNPALEDLNVDGIPDLCQSFATIWVDDDAPFDPGPGDPLVSDPLEDGSQLHPFDAIREAIQLSVDGDRIVLEPGTYRGKGNFDIKPIGKGVQIDGAGPSQTIVDAEGQGAFLSLGFSSYGKRALFQGIGFRGVYGSSFQYGPVVVRNCRFEDCLGTLSSGRRARIEDCTFESSGALKLRGDAGHVLRSTFDGCTGSLTGGAIDLDVRDGLVESCTFRGNAATYGGAIWAWAEDAQGTRIESCLFVDNDAMMGGAVLALMNGRPATHLVSRSTFLGNRATIGGACLITPLSEPSVVFVEDSLFWQNQGLVGPDVTVNEGPYSPSSLDAAEIVFGRTNLPGGLAAVSAVASATLHASAPLFDVDPLLSPDGHLAPGSPLIDQGSVSPDLSPGAVDFEGDPRLLGPAIDVGADEVSSSQP